MKKVAIIAVILVVIVAIVSVIILKPFNKEKEVENENSNVSPTSSDDHTEEYLGTGYGLNIKREDAIYYEEDGSTSVERTSFIYYGENGECKIWTRYFNCGESTVVEDTLSEEEKEVVLNAINDSIKLGEAEPDRKSEQNEGAHASSGVQYINEDAPSKINPINLVKLNIIQDTLDVL